MNGEGKDLTLPTLDLDDFIGLDFTTGLMASSTNCLTNSLPTFTGSALTGSSAKT